MAHFPGAADLEAYTAVDNAEGIAAFGQECHLGAKAMMMVD